MPVVRMEIVDVDQMPKGSVQRLADELGEILGSEDDHTWLRIVPISADHYAENRVVDAARNLSASVCRSATTRLFQNRGGRGYWCRGCRCGNTGSQS